MSLFTEIPNSHEPGQEDLPRRYWPALGIWDVVEMVQGAPIYLVEFIRSTAIPIPRIWLVQEDMVLFDVLRQIGTRWVYTLKVFTPIKYVQNTDMSEVAELWHAKSDVYGKGVAVVRTKSNHLVTPSVVGLDPEELLKCANLVWHRQERIDNKH